MKKNQIKPFLSLGIGHIILICQVSSVVHNEPCESARPIYGAKLTEHVFQSMQASSSIHCLKACENDLRCQSMNYLVPNETCELNNRTREARPADLIPHRYAIYMKRFNSRVRLGTTPEMPAQSCKEIKESEGEEFSVSGYYWFEIFRRGEAVQVFCDMETEDMDECGASKSICDVNAECQNTLGSFKCLCKTGFTGNGLVCNDIDECGSGSHDCLSETATCTNTFGSYNCSCSPSYVGDGRISCVLPECQNYESLTGENRKNTYNDKQSVLCDSTLGPGWFRFQGAAGIKMASSCVAINHCGTHSPGWLNGAHPTVAEGTVTRQVCFNYFSNCCIWSINIQVRNCGDFFMYYISGTPPEHACTLRYCGAD